MSNIIFVLIFVFLICSKLNKVVLTSDNTELLRDSVSTLTKTLKHVEVSFLVSVPYWDLVDP